MDDLKTNAEYTGYTVGSNVVMWFWEVVKAFNKEDRARLLQFVTGTSKVLFEFEIIGSRINAINCVLIGIFSLGSIGRF